jgi:hypothetical protein
MVQQALIQSQRQAQNSTPIASGVLQRKCERCRKKKPVLQRKSASFAPETVPPIAHDVLRSPGLPLHAVTRAFMEPRFAYDFCQIPVHSKSLASIQAKLTVNTLGDIYEQEADRIADHVMTTPAHSAVSGAPLRIQRYAGQADTVPSSVDQVLASSSRPLELALRQEMEPRFGYDFSRVRVHSGGAAEQSAQNVNAHAYTVGHDIVFGAGQFAPGTHEGRRLIAHELTHVVQQSGSYGVGVGPRTEKRGLSSISQGVEDRLIQRDANDSAPAGDSASANAPVNSPSLTGSVQPVYVCTKPILGSMLHRQGHAFFRVGDRTPGHPTYELEHARSCYCGWQGWPRRDVPEDRNADVPCVITPINSATLAANWNKYPVGQYCARGPNSNTYVRVISAMCGSTVRPPGNTAGYDASPPTVGGAGYPHPFLSVIFCGSVDCDDTECGLIPGINQDIVPGRDPEALNAPREASKPAIASESGAADEQEALSQRRAG